MASAGPRRAALRGQLWIAVGQVALIVLSVALGFAATEWRQRAADRALAEQAVAALRAEYEANRDAAAEAVAFRDRLLARLDSAAVGIRLSPARLADNAWASAQAADAVQHLPYEVVSAAGEIHEIQGTYTEIAQTGVQLLYLLNVLDLGLVSGEGSRAFVPVLQDMRGIESVLVEHYDRALALLDSLDAVR